MLKQESRYVSVEERLRLVSQRTLNQHINAFSPILISRKARRNYLQEKPIDSHPYMSIGTGIYLSCAEHRWLITANHVVGIIQNELQSAPIYVRSGSEIVQLFQDRDQIPICRFEYEDLAVIPLSMDSHCNYSDAMFIHVQQSPKFDYAKQFRIGVYGYLNKDHKSISEEINPRQFLSKVGSMKEKETRQLVSLEFNRKSFEGDVADQNFVPQPNGLSGGPVFGLGTVNQIQTNPQQTGTFCGLVGSQNDKGRRSYASFVPRELLANCLSSATETFGVDTSVSVNSDIEERVMEERH